MLQKLLIRTNSGTHHVWRSAFMKELVRTYTLHQQEFEKDRAISILVELLRGRWNKRWNAISSQMCHFFFAKQAMRVDILYTIFQVGGNSRRVSCVDLMLWLTLKTRCNRNRWIGLTQAKPKFGEVHLWRNCFVVVETKGEMQFRATSFNFG